ncbi:hypothetical protein AOZ07_11510 [Glutamicibacter halophytocola]|uniref:hypothetical protein n=1 Tax=Glutamicibacter halophytocola TaxID=1933880 RepID=UPI0006D4BB99|nr:hypothetical protein [Glutamicibacter halophytocola]ALG29545.1 hypothetical protein AOZ07_11510 [Glutamicibacter halophytocola]
MKYEYKQVKYRADKGKFDGNLNQMAEQGWKVESMDRMDDVFLVTYSRVTEQKLEHVHCEVKDLQRILARRTQDRLVAFASESGWANLVWEVGPGQDSPTTRNTPPKLNDLRW